MTTAARLRHFIGGEWQSSESDAWIPDVNPSDAEDIVGEVPAGTVDDVRRAVTAAEDAVPVWRGMSGPARADALYKWGEAIASRGEALAQLVAREVGKPIGEARGEVGRCVTILRYYAGEAVRATGRTCRARPLRRLLRR